MTREDGSVVSIVYRNGGFIDAEEVNDLCVKVTNPSHPRRRKAQMICRLSISVWPGSMAEAADRETRGGIRKELSRVSYTSLR